MSTPRPRAARRAPRPATTRYPPRGFRIFAPPPPPCQLARQCVVEISPRRHRRKEVGIHAPGLRRAQVVRVSVQERHPTVGADELHFFQPQSRLTLAQDLSHGVVLRKRVRQLDELSELEWPDAHGSTRDRLTPRA